MKLFLPDQDTWDTDNFLDFSIFLCNSDIATDLIKFSLAKADYHIGSEFTGIWNSLENKQLRKVSFIDSTQVQQCTKQTKCRRAHSHIQALWSVFGSLFQIPQLSFSIFLFPRPPDYLSTLELKQKLYTGSPVLYIKYGRKGRDSPSVLQIS